MLRAEELIGYPRKSGLIKTTNNTVSFCREPALKAA